MKKKPSLLLPYRALILACALLLHSQAILAQSPAVFTPLPLVKTADVAAICDPVLQAKKYYPAIAGDTLGRGAVAWLDERDGLRDVYIRFYDGGDFTTSERKVNNHPQGAAEAAPALSCNARGEGVVAWLEFDNRIRFRRFTTDGKLLPIETYAVENADATFIGSPSVAVGPDGGFLISWEEYVRTGGYAVRARLFHADGSPASEALVVSEFMPRWKLGYQLTDENAGHAAVDGDGRYCVIWLHFLTFDIAVIRASIIDGGSATVSVPFTLSSEEQPEWLWRGYPIIRSNRGAGFFAAWQESKRAVQRIGWCRIDGEGSVVQRDTIPGKYAWSSTVLLRDGHVLFPQSYLMTLEPDGTHRDGQYWISSNLPEPFKQYQAGPVVMAEGRMGTLTAVMNLSVSMHGGQGHYTRQLALQQLDTAMNRLTPLVLCGTEQCSKDEVRPLVARNDRNQILVTFEHSGSAAPTIGATTCERDGTPSGRQSGMLPQKYRQPLRLFDAVAFPGQGGSFAVLRGENFQYRTYSLSLATLGRDGSNKLAPIAIDKDARVLQAGMAVDAAGNIHVLYLTSTGELRRCLFSETLERLEENRTIYTFTQPAPEHLNRISVAMHPDAGAVVSIASGPYNEYYSPLSADTLVTVVFDRNGIVLDRSLRQINAVPQGFRYLRNAIAADGRVAVLWNDVLSTGRHLLRIERHEKGSAVARDSSAYGLAQMREMFVTLQWTGRDELLATWAQNAYFDGVLIDDAFGREWPMRLHGATLRENQYFNDHLTHDVMVIDSTLYLFHESNERLGEGYNVRLRMLRLPSREVELPSAFTFDITPMPSAGAATLRFALGTDTPVRVTLHDLLGREVRAVEYGTLSRGNRRVALPTDGLASGVYLCRVSAGESATRPLLIVR